MKFVNVEKFEAWIRENIRCEFYGIEPYLDDVEKQICACGSYSYELSAFESKSGCPELYSVDIEHIEVDEDEWETIITF